MESNKDLGRETITLSFVDKKRFVPMPYKKTKSVCFIKNKKSRVVRVDKIMANLIVLLNLNDYIETLGCCCGHLKYPPSIVVKDHRGVIWEVISGITIPRKKRFYKKDKEGYYFIPECNKKV